MPRHGRNDPQVERITSELARMVLRFGSVNAVAEELTKALNDASGRVYPKRIHGLLTDDPSRGVNSATLTTLETAFARVVEPETWAIAPDAVESALNRFSGQDQVSAVQHVANQFGVPIGVVQLVTRATPRTAESSGSARSEPQKPDWSWQDTAVRESVSALNKGGGRKVGLVLPTGGGKTRVALRVALEWLDRVDGHVLWVTHRRHLERQARRTLQTLIREAGLSPEQAGKTFARIQFSMTHGLADKIAQLQSSLSLIIVDEAHHVAATSYQSVLATGSVPGLFLTATPNRTDALPLGIDEICYTITYRELFKRGCIIEPTFDPPKEMPNLDWSSAAGLRGLADYLLDRTESDFSKPLVAVSLQERAELLHDALLTQLDERESHPLSAEDIGYVHGASNSRRLAESSDFLDEFAARPAGILIATSQLVGEGFDDPSLDAAVITYPSSSIGHLMQVAGRALRWTTGKSTAHIVQVRQSPIEYHFEQRWLYQDISDALRPALVDHAYSSPDDLRVKVVELLREHNVAEAVRKRIGNELAASDPGERISILLSGLSYFGDRDQFDDDALWAAILVSQEERERFLGIFNDVSARADDIKESHAYLMDRMAQDLSTGSLWRSYGELLAAMEFARRETQGVDYYGREKRDFYSGRATSWLKYVTFSFRPTVPEELQEFLRDAYNRDELLAAYTADPKLCATAIRLELPAFGAEGFLLDAGQSAWFVKEQALAVDDLSRCERKNVLSKYASWRHGLESIPIPFRLIDHFEQFLRPETQSDHVLDLSLLSSV
jgi:hypothetical protein